MNQALHKLEPGDHFLVDFNGRPDSKVYSVYHPYRDLWLTVIRVFGEEQDTYSAKYQPEQNGGRELSENEDEQILSLVWIPVTDFNRSRAANEPLSNLPPKPRQSTLPDI